MMDETAAALFALTREMGGLTEAVKNQGREIGELKTVLEKRSEACNVCRGEIDTKIASQDGEISTIKSKHTGEQAVTSWLNTGLGQCATVIGIVSGILALLVLAWPVVQRVM